MKRKKAKPNLAPGEAASLIAYLGAVIDDHYRALEIWKPLLKSPDVPGAEGSVRYHKHAISALYDVCSQLASKQGLINGSQHHSRRLPKHTSARRTKPCR